MKRGIVGGSSVAAGTVLVLGLFRGPSPVPRPAAPTNSGAVQSLHSNAAITEKQPVRVGRKKRPEDGPWKASQARFAGWEGGQCPGIAPQKADKSKDIANLGNVVLKLERRDSRKAGLNQKDPRSYLWCIPKPERESVRALIAIVPDPVQTNVQLQFDRTIDSLQLAAESAGYVIDHYWLPWDLPESTEYADYSSRKAALRDQQEKQEQPGLLLFRLNVEGGQKEPDTLFMFLVSDTSTAGVNGAQFEKAVKYIGEVCWNEKNCGNDPITIIGPSFSGSLASLRHLTEQRNEHLCAYSGTISSRKAVLDQRFVLQARETVCDPVKTRTAPLEQFVLKRAELTGEGDKRHIRNGGHVARGGQPGKLEFIPFMHDTEDALTLVSDWLRRIHEAESTFKDYHCDLAIFAEAGTTYGGSAAERTENAGKNDPSVPLPD